MRRLCIPAAAILIGVLSALPSGAAANVAETRVINPDGGGWHADTSGFGAQGSIGVTGTRVAAGVRGYGPGASGPYTDKIGRVYLFQCGAAGCALETALDPSDGVPWLQMGSQVAISGDVVVATAGHGFGKAYAFELAGGIWRESILAPAGVDESFGRTVAIDEKRIVISDPMADNHLGAVYVFERYGGGWNQTARLTPLPTDVVGTSMGSSLDVSGDVIVAGAAGATAVYVFEKQGTSWNRTKLISPDGENPWAGFGQAVAVDSGRVFVAAGFGGFGSGEVFVFEKRGTWRFRERIHPTGVSNSFGYDITADSGRLLVSEGNVGIWIGTPTSTDWVWEQAVASDTDADLYFAASVGLGEDLAVTGATVKLGNTTLDARLYVYQMCQGKLITRRGTDGPDVINGTAGDDVIHLFGGNDTSNGMAGADTICGGFGHDALVGGTGPDHLDGGPGNDVLRGSEGPDQLRGGPGDDRIRGSTGNDWIWGGLGDDQLHGEEGNDRLIGGPGSNLLFGDGGNVEEAGTWDWADYGAAAAGVTIDLALGTATGPVTDTLADIENVRGSRFDDSISGDDGRNTIRGFGGDDWIFGRGGQDQIAGNSGDDRLIGGDGDDRLAGNLGYDIGNGGSGRDVCVTEKKIAC